MQCTVQLVSTCNHAIVLYDTVRSAAEHGSVAQQRQREMRETSELRTKQTRREKPLPGCQQQRYDSIHFCNTTRPTLTYHAQPPTQPRIHRHSHQHTSSAVRRYGCTNTTAAIHTQPQHEHTVAHGSSTCTEPLSHSHAHPHLRSPIHSDVTVSRSSPR